MKRAIETYSTGNYSLKAVCHMFNLPRTTFRRHALCQNKMANMGKKCSGRQNTFDAELEQHLENHILHLQTMFGELTVTEVCQAAYDLAEKNNIKHTFNSSTKMAGIRWFLGFMRRHPNLSVKNWSVKMWDYCVRHQQEWGRGWSLRVVGDLSTKRMYRYSHTREQF